MIMIAGILLTSYLLGAVPFSLLIGFTCGTDIREHGSGNTGATNLYRNTDAGAAIVGFILDVAKGWVPVFLVLQFGETVAGLSGDTLYLVVGAVGLLAIIGHCFPVYLLFQGGKGVATSFGVFLGLSPVVTGMAFLIWFLVVAVTRYVSLGSLIAAASFPIWFYLIHEEPLGIYRYLLFASVMAAGIIWGRHHENIGRLWKGEESKIGS